MKVLEIRKLKNETEIATLKIYPTVKSEHLTTAIEFLCKKGLKHSFINGKTYMGREVIMSPIGNDKFETFEAYEDLFEAVEYNLAYEVLNCIKKLENGFKLK